MTKRYYWLKLKDDFFDKKEIKRLRRMAGGDTYTIIYLKMLLLSLKTNGQLYFDNIGEDFVDELSLQIDEDMDNVKMTLTYLQSKGLLEIVSDHEYHLNELPEMVGSESDSAERKRRQRDENNLIENKNRDNVTVESQSSHTEKEKEKEKDIDTDDYIYAVFNHWKNQNIINHRELTQKMKSAINARLKSYSVDELKQAISNYQEILNSDEYYWTHKWTIQDFMKPDNVVRFLDESNPKQNFKSSYKPDNKERKVAWF